MPGYVPALRRPVAVSPTSVRSIHDGAMWQGAHSRSRVQVPGQTNQVRGGFTENGRLPIGLKPFPEFRGKQHDRRNRKDSEIITANRSVGNNVSVNIVGRRNADHADGLESPCSSSGVNEPLTTHDFLNGNALPAAV